MSKVKVSKVKDKEKILNSIEQLVAYKGTPVRLSADIQQKFCRSEVEEYNQNGERKKLPASFYSIQPGYVGWLHTHTHTSKNTILNVKLQ